MDTVRPHDPFQAQEDCRPGRLEQGNPEHGVSVKLPIPHRVLLVCTANQCRSAAAEFLLKPKLAAAHLNVQVGSAGTHAWPDVSPLPHTVKAAGELGLDMRDHRSQAVTKELLETFDLVLAMADQHVETLLSIDPFAARRVFLFKPFCEGKTWQAADPSNHDNIEDPVGEPYEKHVECVRLLDTLLDQLVSQWKAQVDAAAR
jgi:protein-tyrosine phosphatase